MPLPVVGHTSVKRSDFQSWLCSERAGKGTGVTCRNTDDLRDEGWRVTHVWVSEHEYVVGLIRKLLSDFCASTFSAGLPMLEESLSRLEGEGPRTTRLVADRNGPNQR